MTEPIPGFPNILMTPNPEAGFHLAIKLLRLGVNAPQLDMDILKNLRPEYSKDADALIASAQVIAKNYQTIATANDYWRAH